MNKFVATALLLGLAVSASAGTIVDFNTTPNNGHNGVAFGQSVTTPNGGPWDNIQFNFFNGNDPSQPYSLGGLYVLTEAYAGTPGGLSSSTAGYLGFTNTVNDNVWEFSSLTLNANTQYYFYMNTAVPLGTVMSLFDTGSGYAGGAAYGAGGASNQFGTGPADMLFNLSGDQVTGAPEPGTITLMAGVAGLLAVSRRRAWFRKQ